MLNSPILVDYLSMGEQKMEQMTLPALFEHVRKIHQMASDSVVDQETLRKGCEALRQCEEMISKLGLFSANETRDDISTANLKYILVILFSSSEALKIHVFLCSVIVSQVICLIFD